MKPDARSRSNARHNPQRYGDRVLRSWNEIADFVSRSVRTVQRWEEFYDFPIHRSDDGVHALPLEIDEWMARPLSFRRSLDLKANRRWSADLHLDAKEAITRSQELRKQAQNERADAQKWHKRA